MLNSTEPVNCDDFVIKSENPDICGPLPPACTQYETEIYNGMPLGICLEYEAPEVPATVAGVPRTLPSTGPAPYAPTLGALGVIAVMFGAVAVRFARR